MQESARAKEKLIMRVSNFTLMPHFKVQRESATCSLGILGSWLLGCVTVSVSVSALALHTYMYVALALDK